jgi:hypothetical protein
MNWPCFSIVMSASSALVVLSRASASRAQALHRWCAAGTCVQPSSPGHYASVLRGMAAGKCVPVFIQLLIYGSHLIKMQHHVLDSQCCYSTGGAMLAAGLSACNQAWYKQAKMLPQKESTSKLNSQHERLLHPGYSKRPPGCGFSPLDLFTDRLYTAPCSRQVSLARASQMGMFAIGCSSRGPQSFQRGCFLALALVTTLLVTACQGGWWVRVVGTQPPYGQPCQA